MKRFNHSIYHVSGLLAMVLIGSPALAAPSFNNGDLKGEYLCTINDIQQKIDYVEYCVIAANVNFDGSGMVAGDSTARCGVSGMNTSYLTHYYSVNPDGSFLVSSVPDMSDPFHGQIVDHGRSLLMDGTLRTAVENLSWSGICMRR